MLKFHPTLIQTGEIEGEISLLIHSFSGCPFNCMGCLNKKEMNCDCQKNNILSEETVLKKVKQMDGLVTCVALSGGEFLNSPFEPIKNFLLKLRENFSGCVIIYSNGYYPKKIEKVFEEKLIDGIHMDLKLPYFSLKSNNFASKKILGKSLNKEELKDIRRSIELIAKFGGKSAFRTVKYPLLEENIFTNIKKEVDFINKKFKSSIPWRLNEFIEPN